MQNLRNLYNQALVAVGAAPEVTDPERPSKATDICNLFFPLARRSVFTAFHWPSVRKVARLARLSTRDTSQPWQTTDPFPGESFAFALPSDIVQPQYLADYTRFALGRFGDENALHTNTAQPLLHYTCNCSNPELWAADLYHSVVFSLAAHINMAKSGKLQNTRALEQRVYELVENASVNEANSDDEYFESIPAHWAGTGFSVPSHQARFIYPTQTFRVGGMSL